jgi:hypothetical protein
MGRAAPGGLRRAFGTGTVVATSEERKGGATDMPEWVGVLVILALWVALQAWVLPRLGVST